MRKDVQIGFVIGVILLAGLVVYVLVVPGGSRKPGADLSLTPPVTTPAATDPAPATRPSDAPVITITETPAAGTTETAAAPTTAPSLSGPVATTTPPTANWNGLLNGSESLPTMMTRTPGGSSGVSTVGPSVTTTANDPFAAPTTRPAVTELGTMSSAGTTPAGRTHTIAKGETLASIAKATYGNAGLYTKILAANPKINPKNLRVGAVITLPDVKSETTTEQPTVTATETGSHTSAAIGNTYKVQRGDTLHSIASKLYGKRGMWQKIYDLNKETIGSDPAKLKLNMVLKLPEAPAAAAAR